MSKDLISDFHGLGIEPTDAVQGWWGGRPQFGGYGHGFMPRLTFWRVFALVGDQVQVWSMWTGIPTKHLRSKPVRELRRIKHTKKYDRFELAGYRFWIRSADGDRVMAWNPNASD